MHTLIIQHIGTNPDKFEVLRLQDGKRTPAVEITAPSEFPVEGRPDSNLSRELRWFLDPVQLSEKLPKDCVNILLVTARPFENDVRYRSISRLLVELIESKNLPAHVHVLRPPTFDNLREHLRKHPNFYHILHFDGHGAYGNMSPENTSGFTFKGKEGCLAFETEDGKQDLILRGRMD